MSNNEEQNKPNQPSHPSHPRQAPEPKPEKIPFERQYPGTIPLNVPGRRSDDPNKGGGRPPSKKDR